MVIYDGKTRGKKNVGWEVRRVTTTVLLLPGQCDEMHAGSGWRDGPLQPQRELQPRVSSSQEGCGRDTGPAERDPGRSASSSAGRVGVPSSRWSGGSTASGRSGPAAASLAGTRSSAGCCSRAAGSARFRRCRIDRDALRRVLLDRDRRAGRLLPAHHRVRLRRPGPSDGINRGPADPGCPGRGCAGAGLPQGPLARLNCCPRDPDIVANECDDRSREDGHCEFSTFGHVDGGPGSASRRPHRGPGIVVAATGVGAGDLVATLIAGSNFGYTLLWAAVLGCLVKISLAEAPAAGTCPPAAPSSTAGRASAAGRRVLRRRTS